MTLSFQQLDLSASLLGALDQLGYHEMTPIQAQALPWILSRQDVSGQAETGSGKTAAFGLGMLQRLKTGVKTPQGLVLCPTRELAEQVASELRRLAQRMPNTRIASLCGGRPYRDQDRALRGGVQLVVGTPGRLGKHLRKGSLDLSQLGVLVLDEADRLLDMGFMDQVQLLVDACPQERQTLLFSATFPEAIRTLSASLQRSPKSIRVSEEVDPSRLVQRFYRCESGQRTAGVRRLIAHHRPERVLIFCETRTACEHLAAALQARGAPALPLHGQLDQRVREETLLQFTNGSLCVLVATNVAARGIDIPQLPMVLISELSGDPETHLHRIGRTGRAGEPGLAVSLVEGRREAERLDLIESCTGVKIRLEELPSVKESLRFLEPEYRTLLLLAGRRDKLSKGDVLGSLVKEGGLPPEAIGRIDLLAKVTAVAVARDHAEQALRHVQQGRVKSRRLRGRLLG